MVHFLLGILNDALGVPFARAPAPPDTPSGRWLIITSTLPFIEEEDVASTDVLGVPTAAESVLKASYRLCQPM